MSEWWIVASLVEMVRGKKKAQQGIAAKHIFFIQVKRDVKQELDLSWKLRVEITHDSC